MNKDSEKDLDYFEKEDTVQSSYYLKKNVKSDFQKICTRLGTSCNKEIKIFIESFNVKHLNVLNATRK